MPQIRNATPTYYNGVKYRSKLEAECAKVFDEAGIEFDYEPFKIVLLPEFTYMGKKFQAWTYKPDFIILGNIMLEAKGFAKADNYVNKRKMILKHILDKNLNYMFFEIYSSSHLRNILNRYKRLNNFYDAYMEYDKELKAKQKIRRTKKRKVC